MRNNQLILAAIIGVILAALMSMFTVLQTQQVILLRLGKIETNAHNQPIIFKPGIHFKIPLVESVKRFDMRLRTLDIDSSRIMTKEQKEVLVDAFVKWRIINPVAYFKTTGANISQAKSLLQQQLNDGIRAEFGQQTISDLLSQERGDVMKEILANVKQAAKPLGIQVVDMRIKRIDLPTEVAETIFARMRSAREKMASLIRAEGQQQAEVIKAQADAKVAVTLANANSQAAKVRAMGEAQAAKIYADDYQKDPEFYSFYRSLLAYNKVFTQKQDTVVLSPTGQFFKYFNKLGNVVAGS